MFFLDIDGLKDHLRKNDPNDTYLAITYFVIWTYVGTAIEGLMKFFTGTSEQKAIGAFTATQLIGPAMALFVVLPIALFVMRGFYRSNGGREHFFERLIPIAFVVSTRASAFTCPIILVGFVLKDFLLQLPLLLIPLVILYLIAFIVYIIYATNWTLAEVARKDQISPTQPIDSSPTN